MAWVTLQLTSPDMTDALVRQHGGGEHQVTDAQHLLAKNPYGNFETGAIDGDFGMITAHATERAKFDLGYLRPDQQFGADLAELLNGRQKLSVAMKVLRAKRLAARRLQRKQMADVMVKAQNYMKGQLGYRESPPESNRNKFGVWYGTDGVPWCAISVTYCVVAGAGYAKRGSFVRGSRWAYVPYIVADARSRRNGLEVVSAVNVKQGDLCCYDWEPKDGTADHVEFFDSWVVEGSSFHAVGGNTGPAGGEVARSVRSVTEVENFVRAIR
jgi:hypothetical protein